MFRYWYETVMTDFHFFYNLSAILEKRISLSALSMQLLGNVLTTRQCAANISLPFLMNQYIGATNHVAPIYWCCKHIKNLQNPNIVVVCSVHSFCLYWFNWQ
jgi:hypothetical protein